MNNVTLALDGAWKVLVTSLLLGAGLPIILAVVCFVLVLLGIALGITIIVASGFGKAVSFQHIYPTIVGK